MQPLPAPAAAGPGRGRRNAVDLDELRRLAGLGNGITALSRQLGVHRKAIRRLAAEHGIAITDDRGFGSGGNQSPSEFWRENDAALVRLIEAGATASEAARELGVSKNAVIGRVHRIRGLRFANSPEPPEPLEAAAIEFPPPGRCLWPEGHPGDPGFGFCGQPAREEGPYCETHHRRAYVPVVRSQRLSEAWTVERRAAAAGRLRARSAAA